MKENSEKNNTGAYGSVEGAEKELRRCEKINSKPFVLKDVYEVPDARESDFNGMKVVRCDKAKNKDCAVLYLHGSGYIHEINALHVNFAIRLSEKTGATVYLPSYPLSPNNTYRKAYSLLSAYWKELCSHYKKIFLVGDSAGGGIALSLTGIFRDSGERLADKIVVISPLTDSSLTASDYTEYEKKDPLLGVTGIREFAKLWSDTTDPEDPSISPLFGSSRGFPQTLVLAGTHECLYPDIIKYYEKINKEGVDATLVTGKKMNHVWPLYPIREAERALGCIAGFLLNN